MQSFIFRITFSLLIGLLIFRSLNTCEKLFGQKILDFSTYIHYSIFAILKIVFVVAILKSYYMLSKHAQLQPFKKKIIVYVCCLAFVLVF